MSFTYTRSSKSRHFTKEEYLQYINDIKASKTYFSESERVRDTRERILDSSLITRTNTKIYTHKIIRCGKYLQVYNYYNIKTKTDKNLEKMKKSFIKIENNELYKLDKKENKNNEKVILYKNIMRSKFNLQRLVKTNEDRFTTFITLTFKENITDIKQANKLFSNFVRQIKKVKNDFCYICVPEFQKRGAVHYHLLTNINYNDDKIISQTEKRIWDRNAKKYNNFRTISYGFNYGFTNVQNLDKISNVVGYISKYMTKDIDNRLFGHRRYLYSQNLDKPITEDLNLLDLRDLEYFFNNYNLDNKIYSNLYHDKIGQVIEFNEYKI